MFYNFTQRLLNRKCSPHSTEVQLVLNALQVPANKSDIRTKYEYTIKDTFQNIDSQMYVYMPLHTDVTILLQMQK